MSYSMVFITNNPPEYGRCCLKCSYIQSKLSLSWPLSSSKLQPAIVPFGLTDFLAWNNNISEYVTWKYVWNAGYCDLNFVMKSSCKQLAVCKRLQPLLFQSLACFSLLLSSTRCLHSLTWINALASWSNLGYLYKTI